MASKDKIELIEKHLNEEIERGKRFEDYMVQKRIDDGVRKGLTKWAVTICMTATSAVIGAVYTFGGFIYRDSTAISEAIKAYLTAKRNGQ